MSKQMKEMITGELTSRYAANSNAVWIELVGVDGLTTTDFRRDLNGKSMRVEIVKNSLFRRATQDGPLARLGEVVEGPAAIVTGGDSAIEIAKIVENWLPKIKTLRLRGAVLEGEFLDEGAVKNLSKMPSKSDLQAQVVSIVQSPGAKVAGAIKAPGANLLAVFKALIEKLEKSETIAGGTAPASVAEAPVATAPVADAPVAEEPAPPAE